MSISTRQKHVLVGVLVVFAFAICDAVSVYVAKQSVNALAATSVDILPSDEREQQRIRHTNMRSSASLSTLLILDRKHVMINFIKEQNPSISTNDASKFAQYFEEAGRMFAIDPLLLCAVARVESTFRRDSDNGVHRGLMQINWELHNRTNGITNAFGHIKTLKDVFEPKNNIHVGAYLLWCKKQVSRDKNINTAIAMYGSGASYRKRVLKFYSVLKKNNKEQTAQRTRVVATTK